MRRERADSTSLPASSLPVPAATSPRTEVLPRAAAAVPKGGGQLRRFDRRQARVVELRFFADVSVEEGGRRRFGPALLRQPPPGVVDQDPARELRRDREEAGPVARRRARLVDEAHRDAVRERRRLQGVPRPLAGELPAGDPPELLVDERDQRVARPFVAAAPLLEETGDVAALGPEREAAQAGLVAPRTTGGGPAVALGTTIRTKAAPVARRRSTAAASASAGKAGAGPDEGATRR